MFTLTIPTTPILLAAETAVAALPLGPERSAMTEGKVLADYLRTVADKIEQDIQIVPADDSNEWTPETYRHATRVNGTLIGAVWTLDTGSR